MVSIVFIAVYFWFIALRSDKIQETILTLLYLGTCDLWPRMWSRLEKVPWAAEKSVHCVSVG